MGDDVVGKAEGDVGDVRQAVQVGAAGGHDELRLEADQIVDDGQIVRRQVPDDVHVVLKEPQVDASGIVVVEPPQDPAVDQFLDLADGTAEQKRVIHHDLQIFAVSQLDQILR